MGGSCAKLNIWWQISWSDLGEDVARSVRETKISINVLELAAIVVNYLAVMFRFAMQKHGLKHQPRVHVGGDNTTADAWYKNFSTTNDSARQLTKMLAFMMTNCNVETDVKHVAGILFISAFFPKVTPAKTSLSKSQLYRDILRFIVWPTAAGTYC